MECCLPGRHVLVLGSVPKLGVNLSNLQRGLRREMSYGEIEKKT